MKKETGKRRKIGEAMGIDLSDRTARFCHIDAEGEVKAAGKVQLTAEALKKEFGGLPAMRMAIESGGQSGWVMRCLEGMGHEVIVANPRALPSITGSTRKSDERDAEQLGRLARVDEKLLKPVTVRNETEQLDLVQIRARALLVETRTRLVNGARGLAKLEGARIPSGSTDHFASRATGALTGKLLAALSPLLQLIDQLSASIEAIDQKIEIIAAEQYPQSRYLSQVPGVGTLTALTFVLTLGNPERFAHRRDVGPFLGMTPKRQQTGEQDPELSISKCGDRYLRKLLVQCAHHVMGRYGPECALKEWATAHAGNSKRAKKRTVVAVARKLGVLLHRLWKRKELYRAFPAAQPV